MDWVVIGSLLKFIKFILSSARPSWLLIFSLEWVLLSKVRGWIALLKWKLSHISPSLSSLETLNQFWWEYERTKIFKIIRPIWDTSVEYSFGNQEVSTTGVYQPNFQRISRASLAENELCGQIYRSEWIWGNLQTFIIVISCMLFNLCIFWSLSIDYFWLSLGASCHWFPLGGQNFSIIWNISIIKSWNFLPPSN